MCSSITASFFGGVGNQLFQVAIAYAYSRKYNLRLIFEKNEFGGCRQGSHPSKYYDSIFEKLPFQEDPLTSKIIINERAWRYYNIDPEIERAIAVGSPESVICLNGYFQSELHFKEYAQEIKALFTPRIGIIDFLKQNSTVFDTYPELLDQTNDFCFVGIRRGDYVTHWQCHNPCGKTYYNSAMEKIPATKYYILSDDLSWVKRNYVGPQYVYLDISDDLIQFYVITLFKKYIISNSSFYWWGSYLSIYDDVQIVAPDKWVNVDDNSKESYMPIYRDEMQIIERPIELD
jgi:Glycosyl transferase family 11